MPAVFISGSIRLGHAEHGLAIARELRKFDRAVEIPWLVGDTSARGKHWRDRGPGHWRGLVVLPRCVSKNAVASAAAGWNLRHRDLR